MPFHAVKALGFAMQTKEQQTTPGGGHCLPGLRFHLRSIQKPQLFLPAGLYRARMHGVLRLELPTEQRGEGVVRFGIVRDGFGAVGGVAIFAPVAAGVVHADVDAGRAAACGALVPVLLQGEPAPGQLLQQAAVDAVAVRDAEPPEVDCFSASLQYKAVPAGDLSQALRQLRNFLFRERRKAQTAQAGLRVSVEVDKADDAFVRIPLQPLSHLAESGDMEVCRVAGGEQNGVVPPDDALGADHVRQRLKSREEHGAFTGQARFHIFTERGQGELEIVWIRPQLLQPGHQRPRIFGPEYDAVHHIRRQRNAADLVEVHGGADADKPLPEAVAKPVRIIGGNIGPSAGADDQTDPPFFYEAHTPTLVR